MAKLVYILCALTSMGCAGLLLRSYLQKKTRLLLWSSIGFMGLAINNILLYLDIVVYTAVDLQLWRNLTTLAGLLALMVGLIGEIR